MNIFIHKFKFSVFYALTFGIISALASIIIFHDAIGKGWNILWIYTGSGSMITAFLFARYFIEKPKKFNNIRLIFIAILVGIFSHWLSWYEVLVVNYIRWEFFNVNFYSGPVDPIKGLFFAALMTYISLIVFGWTAIPFSIVLIYLSKIMNVKYEN